MQKHVPLVNLVDLVKSFPTNIFLQNLASIQKRTSPVKSAHLAEKSEKRSISNLSTKEEAASGPLDQRRRGARCAEEEHRGEEQGRCSEEPKHRSCVVKKDKSRPEPKRLLMKLILI